MTLKVERIACLQGRLRPPSDKSLTHRAYMFAAAATSPSEVTNPLLGEDCVATLRCLKQMGLRADDESLVPASDWFQPEADLDCGNSGTTMRLLSGLIASHPISATLTGDESLSKRPMRRIAEPLRLMGGEIIGDRPPLTVIGSNLRCIDYESPVSSAQVKSAILLASLRAQGTTRFQEPHQSRDHTERMLTALGVKIITNNGKLVMEGRQTFEGFRFRVPADISSAAFWMVAGALVPGSEVVLEEVGVNPSRTGILDVFREVGVSVTNLTEETELGEPLSTIQVTDRGALQPFEISGALVPRLIDEIPVLCVLATQCDGVSSIRGASELRVKESDRIELVASGLRSMGAQIEVFDDGMSVMGPSKLSGAVIDSKGDHRIGMAFAIAGLVAEGSTTILNADSISTSYPNFERDLWSLAVV